MPLPGAGEPSAVADAAEGEARVAADGIAGDGFGIAACGGAGDFDFGVGWEDGEVEVVDFDVEAFAGFDFFSFGIVGGDGGADFFQGVDGAAVVAEFEMAEADVVVGFVDAGGGGEFLDHIPHDGEAFAVVSALVEAGTGVEEGVGAL